MKDQRRSLRLRDYDYRSRGAYFVTLVTFERLCLFGAVVDDAVHLNDTGHIVEHEWLKTARVRSNIDLDEFVVMPNHLHGILLLDDGTAPPNGSTRRFGSGQAGSIGTVIGQFKSLVTKKVRARLGNPDLRVWQRNYWERVIRNEAELARARKYIHDNPAKWSDDQENPAFVMQRPTSAIRHE